MSVSQVSICNSALIKVGAERISAITEDNKRAKILAAVWDQTRDSILRAHKWNFATKRVTLAPTSDTPEWGYDYEYDLPNDLLRLLEPDPDTIEFVVEGRKILTDEDSLDVLYIYRHEDESDWDACFAEAMAWGLAAEIAYNLTQSSTLSQLCDQKYQKVIAEARWADSTEGSGLSLEADDWTESRKSGRRG